MFCVIAIGVLARRVRLLDDASTAKMNSVAFKAFLPFLLFYNVYCADLSSAVQPGMIAYGVGGILGVYALATFVVRAVEKRPEKQSVMIQGIFRSNFVLLGLPIAQSIFKGQDLGPTAIMIAIAVPMFNALAVITLELYRGGRVNVGHMLLDIAKNPLIIGAAIGIVFLICEIRLPAPLEKVAGDMAGAASPLTLFLLGASFKFSGLREHRRNLIIAVTGRLVFVPALCLTGAALLGFRGAEFVTLLGLFSSPNAVSSFTMAQQMGGDADLAADIVVLTSGLACVTMFLWTFLFKQLGLY